MIKIGEQIANQAERIKVFCLLFLLLAMLFSGLSEAADSRTEIVVYYFYANGCESCSEADDTIRYYMDILRNSQYKIKLLNYNIEAQQGLELIYLLCDTYQVPEEQQKVPLMFLGDSFFYGEKEITRGLEQFKVKLDQEIAPMSLYIENQDNGEELVKNNFNSNKILNLFIVGLINGLNPCSLSMLLLFLSALLTRPEVSILKIGFAFIVGKFLAYLLLGTLLYEMFAAIDSEGYKMVLKISVGVFIGIVAFLNIRDYFAAKREAYGEIKNQLPLGLRKWNHQIIAKYGQVKSEIGLIIVSGILGVIISIGEFLCTGQVYLATIIYVLQSDSGDAWRAFSLFFLYSLAFVIPATILLIILARTGKILSVSELLRKRLATIKLLTSVVLIIVGIAIIAFT